MTEIGDVHSAQSHFMRYKLPAGGINESRQAILLVLIMLGVWVVTHPYRGLVHDTVIYIGFAVAEGAPERIGRDIMFAYDKQSEFSLFPLLLRLLVQAFGPAPAAAAASATAVLLWASAAVFLLTRLVPPDLRLITMIFAALVSSEYGAFEVFTFGETMATPRPFAEAFVLIAFAMALRDRMAWTAALLVVAAALHPIMALPGIVCLFLVLVSHNRIWLLLIPLGLVVLLAAAVMQIGPAERLFQGVDQTWKNVLIRRAPYLFPTLWPSTDWLKVALEVITLAAACFYTRGRVRLLLGAALCVSLAGLAMAILLGDLMSSVLIVQMQLWRFGWISAVLAVLCAPLTLRAFVTQGGPFAYATGAFLLLAWLMASVSTMVFIPVLVSALMILLLLIGYAPQRRLWQVVAAAVLVTWCLLAIWAGMSPIGEQVTSPARVSHLLQYILGLPLLILTVVALRTRLLELRWQLTLAAVLALLFVPTAASSWSNALYRPQIIGPDSEDSKNMLSSGSGEVAWLSTGTSAGSNLSDVEKWVGAGAPQWFAGIQGAPSVFSRDLALEWDRRAKLLVDFGAIRPRSRDLRLPQDQAPRLLAVLSAIDPICNDRSRPTAVALPMQRTTALNLREVDYVWRLGFRETVRENEDVSKPVSHDVVAIFVCQRRRNVRT